MLLVIADDQKVDVSLDGDHIRGDAKALYRYLDPEALGSAVGEVSAAEGEINIWVDQVGG